MQVSGFDDFAGKQRDILSFLDENETATLEQMESALGYSQKDIRETLKRLELSEQVRYSEGKWEAIER
jgi:predicted transcriptional regulator